VLARAALLAPIIGAILFTTAPCVSADGSAPSVSPGVGLATANAVIVPPAWAGVWDVHYEFYHTCTIYPPVSYRDTLCAGDVILVGDRTGVARNALFPPGFPAPRDSCQAPVFTDTKLTFGCSYVSNTCIDRFGNSTNGTDTYRLEWDLSGDVATTVTTYTHVQAGLVVNGTCTTSTSCLATTGTRTRLWPESSFCSVTPTRPASWGRPKLLYR